MHKNIILGLLIFIVAFSVFAVIYGIITRKPKSQPDVSVKDVQVEAEPATIKNMNHLITIKTNFGDIEFRTYDTDAPKAANNFITLAQKGFYNNLTFHRVIKDFMIQGGDPNCNPGSKELCGTGGPGYQFEDELNPNTESYKEGYKRGAVAMANAGPNTNGSQFFIMLKDTPLPHLYTIFGKVLKGQEIVDAIGVVKTDSSDKPISPVIIKEVLVQETQ